MAKLRDSWKWLKRLVGVIAPSKPQSIIERLEGLIPPVEKIRDSYKVDRQIALEIHKEMLAIEERIWKTLKDQQQAIAVQELLIEQQDITGDIIEVQYYKSLDAETIINNLREWLLGDDLTIGWMLENALVPAFGRGFAKQKPERQRALFSELRVAVNILQKIDGMLTEPGREEQSPPRGRIARGGR